MAIIFREDVETLTFNDTIFLARDLFQRDLKR